MSSALGVFVFLFIFFQYSTACSTPPTVDFSWSHRQVAHVSVNPDIPEGSLFLTFSSDQAITPIAPPPGLESIDAFNWRINLTWDDLDPLTISFANATEETTQVTALYSPLMPLDPLLHDMPVLNVITAPVNLWSPESGLHVFGLYDNCLQHGEDWERPAVFQYFHGSNSPEISEPIGLRINGGWSRNVDQKGLRFYFDDYGENESIDYDFFGNSPVTFQRLLTRTGRWPAKSFNSVFAEGLFMDLGHLGSRSRDVTVYLNNEYFGFVTLRERVDEEFIEHTHNLDEAGYSLIKDGSTTHGNSDSWWTFLDSCREDHVFESHEWFSHVTANLDLTSYVDWLLINILGASADNGGTANVTVWQMGSEPWQFIMYDEDELFHGDNLNADLFNFLSISTTEEFNQYRPSILFSGSASDRIKWAAPFRGLMQNSEFKILFKTRFEELMTNGFSDSALQSRLNEIKTNQESEMHRHHLRWGQWTGFYNSYVNDVSSWLTQRRPILLDQFDSFLENFRVPVELSGFFATDVSDETVLINWRTESEEDCVGFKLYRGPSPENLALLTSYETNSELLATGGIWQMTEYDFQDDITGQTFPIYYQLAGINSAGTEELLPWTVKLDLPSPPPSLRINEFLALNINGLQDETGTPEDWVEIFNAGTETVNLEGMFLTDNLQATTKWEFPSENIEPGEFLLVWCDSDPENGSLHTTFKLNASGESIGLFDTLANNNQLVDSYDFGPQVADVSKGRSPSDGGTFWISFGYSTPGYSNLMASAASLPPPAFSLGPNHPNPFNPSTNIYFSMTQDGQVGIDVFDINGRLVRCLLATQTMKAGEHLVTWNGCGNDGRSLASGTYFVRAVAGKNISTLKVLLVK